jgi:hypothetical protein
MPKPSIRRCATAGSTARSRRMTSIPGCGNSPLAAPKARSKVNSEHAERLAKAGLMTSAGLAAVEAAKADGRWQAAYDSPRNAAVPEDFLRALSKDKKAKAFFENAEQSERLCDRVSPANGEEAGDHRKPCENDPGNVEPGRKISRTASAESVLNRLAHSSSIFEATRPRSSTKRPA